MKTGWHFESLLQRGLLNYAMGLPNGSPEFRIPSTISSAEP